MRRHGSRLELGVELTPQKPGMILEFNNFDQVGFRIDSRADQPALFKLFQIAVVKFKAVAMAFRNLLKAIDTPRQGVFFQRTGISPKAHGTTLALDLSLFFHDMDNRVCRLFMKLG